MQDRQRARETFQDQEWREGVTDSAHVRRIKAHWEPLYVSKFDKLEYLEQIPPKHRWLKLIQNERGNQNSLKLLKDIESVIQKLTVKKNNKAQKILLENSTKHLIKN